MTSAALALRAALVTLVLAVIAPVVYDVTTTPASEATSLVDGIRGQSVVVGSGAIRPGAQDIYDHGSQLARAFARLGAYRLAPNTLLHGSGPARGVIEVSSGVKSTAAFRNLNPSSARNFIFDPASERFLVGEASKGSGHWGLARTIGASENVVVGGELVRGPDGRYLTNEISGHYGPNWTPTVRQQVSEFMERFGFSVEHTPWRPGG